MTKLTPAVREAIRVDREEHGFTLTQIMERHGLPRTTAYSAIAGLDTRAEVDFWRVIDYQTLV